MGRGDWEFPIKGRMRERAEKGGALVESGKWTIIEWEGGGSLWLSHLGLLIGAYLEEEQTSCIFGIRSSFANWSKAPNKLGSYSPPGSGRQESESHLPGGLHLQILKKTVLGVDLYLKGSRERIYKFSSFWFKREFMGLRQVLVE